MKDKLLLETVLGVELYDPVDRCLFYTGMNCWSCFGDHIYFASDKGSFAFTSVIFYGNEWSLLLFDVLLFAIVDLIAQNYVMAAIITYIIGWVSSKYIAINFFTFGILIFCAGRPIEILTI